MFLAVPFTTSRSGTPSDLLWAGYRKQFSVLGRRSDGGICFLSSQFKKGIRSGQNCVRSGQKTHIRPCLFVCEATHGSADLAGSVGEPSTARCGESVVKMRV